MHARGQVAFSKKLGKASRKDGHRGKLEDMPRRSVTENRDCIDVQ